MKSGSRKKKHLRGSTQAMGLGQYNEYKVYLIFVGQYYSLGVYSDPHTASEVFLILIFLFLFHNKEVFTSTKAYK